MRMTARTQGAVPLLDPVVDRASLHHHVAGLEVDDRIVELHVDLARDDHDVVDGVGRWLRAASPGANSITAEDRPVRQGGRDLAQTLIGRAVVVGRKAFGGPDVTRPSRPAGPRPRSWRPRRSSRSRGRLASWPVMTRRTRSAMSRLLIQEGAPRPRGPSPRRGLRRGTTWSIGGTRRRRAAHHSAPSALRGIVTIRVARGDGRVARAWPRPPRFDRAEDARGPALERGVLLPEPAAFGQ